MNVLHICVNDFMGAGLCASRINKALQKEGVESKMLVVYKHSKDSSISSFGRIRITLYKIINRILYYLSFNLTDEIKIYKLSKIKRTAYSLPMSHLDISKHPLIKEADIIHLHWVNGMIDYPSFFKRVNKPIVWTLHDENLFCGISHYTKTIDNSNPLESKYREIKQKAIEDISNFNVVFLSNYFYRIFSEQEILSRANKFIINNSVDYNRFGIKDKKEVRELLRLNNDLTYLLFIAYDITEERKGLNKLIEAIEMINDSSIRILAIGKCSEFKKHSLVQTFGLINDDDLMSIIISASDYFVMPSSQEAFAQTPIEAMACGVPAIVFPVSGMDELITKDNGIKCGGFTSIDLMLGIKKALVTEYNRVLIRKDIIERFSPQTMAKKYINVYNKAIQKN